MPGQVIGLSGVLTVTGGYEHSAALMPDHTLRAWGLNSDGQLGDGDGSYQSSSVPVMVSGLTNVAQVSAGWKHTVALKSDGTVWAWGRNDRGEVGNGITTTKGMTVPVQVGGLSNVIAVSGGDCHTAALKANDTVWTWGWNINGQLGDNTTTDRNIPVQVIFVQSSVFLSLMLR